MLIRLLVVLALAAGVRAEEVHPVLYQQAGSTGVVLGGLLDGKWLSSERIIWRMYGGEKYKLYTEQMYTTTVYGRKPQDGLVALPGGEWRIAIAGDWDAMPRKARPQSPGDLHVTAVRSYLASKGLSSQVHIDSVLRVDLEGDGTDEVLITAESAKYDPWFYRHGEYSVILLRKVEKGEVRTYSVAGDLHILPPGKEGTDRNGDGLDDGYPEQYSIYGLWDVNGDGTLEIALRRTCPRADAGGVSLYTLRKCRPELLAEEMIGH
ncbi:MAG: hypothetical protein ACYC2Y_08115 [Armatimonadota bacterium]